MMKKLLMLLLLMLPCLVFGDFFAPLDNHNAGMFHMADGWTNGNPFNNTWRSTCVTFNGGIMTLTLDYEGGSPPYKSGEYRTNDNYSYGYFEVRMKASNKQGTVSSFFLYTGPSEDNPWDEIDIEILGKNPWQMQTNYWTNGVGEKEAYINLGFDSSQDFHTYGFEWRSNYIKWYVDGQLVHTETGSKGPLPVTPMKIMMNLWPGIGVDDWLGHFDGQVPQHAYYDCFSYEQNGPSSSTPPPPTPTPTPTLLKGDVNGDGHITIIDALMTAQFYVGLNPQGFNQAVADVSNDGQITIVDALMIAQYYVGLIQHF
jgi:beta-glucanase (GH16 family)